VDKKFEVGEEVYVVYTAFASTADTYYLTHVLSVSPKRGDVKVKDHTVIFDKSGHSKNHDRWARGPHLQHATPKLKNLLAEQKKRNRLLHVVSEFGFKKMCTEHLETVVALIKTYSE
jgi:hypothetical protein